MPTENFDEKIRLDLKGVLNDKYQVVEVTNEELDQMVEEFNRLKEENKELSYYETLTRSIKCVKAVEA